MALPESPRELVWLLGDEDPVALKLARALGANQSAVPLIYRDRRRLFNVLHDPSDGLGELRRALRARRGKRWHGP